MQSEGRFCMVGKSSAAVGYLIAVGFQPIIQGRAKIMRSVESIISSREVVYGGIDILHG